ncbi:MAG TPA: DUF359 domain-containing protein [Candidatus Poseidoniales archaeon]|jgi:phosphopantetheine adenylyltransferase/uncharacterized protein (UPF0218 family)|nr:MAG: hypothetical protein CXT69_02535 [Euryarchaeota archaeon]HIG04068.1 DUF359 domain-containing protein [Candidatus Poseidoniales archaeon]HIK78651.1 DUF359 domain-containing protein [Candidatus Poseidoniales archaeon]
MDRCALGYNSFFDPFLVILGVVLIGIQVSPVVMKPTEMSRCLVGGTFDRFHLGHQVLLQAALRQAKNIEVWITDDKMVLDKAENIQGWDIRSKEVEEWLEEKYPNRGTVHLLLDAEGPAPHREDCDAIVCTAETLIGCERINQKRVGKGLLELEIIVVPHVEDALGGVISSSRIRAGAIDREGNAWIENKYLQSVLHMIPELDGELKRPLGELFTGPTSQPLIAMSKALEAIESPSSLLIAVGDVSVSTLLEMDVVPDIAVIDGLTKRNEIPEDERVNPLEFQRIIKAKSPAGKLTPELLAACKEAVFCGVKCVIEVNGEEDLSPLYLHLLAPLGATIVYGQPGQGVVMCQTEEKIKARCRDLLSMFMVV